MCLKTWVVHGPWIDPLPLSRPSSVRSPSLRIITLLVCLIIICDCIRNFRFNPLVLWHRTHNPRVETLHPQTRFKYWPWYTEMNPTLKTRLYTSYSSLISPFYHPFPSPVGRRQDDISCRTEQKPSLLYAGLKSSPSHVIVLLFPPPPGSNLLTSL